jgi:ABC-2 type transport system ATP-binding protein
VLAREAFPIRGPPSRASKWRYPLIAIEGLTKTYGKRTAVDDLNFTVKEGEIVGFLGPNGAGKSTTMNIITGYISATKGRVTIDGIDVLEDPEAAKRKIGYLPEQPPLYGDMTVDEYLGFVAELKRVPKKDRKTARDEVCELTSIADVRKRVIKNLSKGYKQRIGLAQALIAKPSALILDEPTVGLDPKQIAEIRDLIKRLGKDRTIILSSHILPEVSAVCERILIIDEGRIVADGAPESITAGVEGSSTVWIRAAGAEADIEKVARGAPSVRKVEPKGSIEAGSFDFLVEAEKGKDARKELFFGFAEAKIPLLGMRVANLSLEEVFLRLTTKEREE